MDTADQIHVFDKNRLRSFNKTRKSLMPAYNADTLNDRDLRDIIAYFQSIAAR
jgi:mono/diheme cytochrome c family protein